MDVALSNSIIQTATHLANQNNADALNYRMLDKALDMQAVTAAGLIEAMQASMLPTDLATDGALGTQLNAWA